MKKLLLSITAVILHRFHGICTTEHRPVEVDFPGFTTAADVFQLFTKQQQQSTFDRSSSGRAAELETCLFFRTNEVLV